MSKSQEKERGSFYKENLKLKEAITESGRSVTHVAKKIGLSRVVVSYTINGHYKGTNIVPKIKKELGIK
jgi:DNA transposition AAA+ family ATPase